MNAGEAQQAMKLLGERLQRIEASLAELHGKVDELHRKVDLAQLHATELAKQYRVRP